MRIQIVEDDPIAATLLSASLKVLGHEPTLAMSGLEGWTQFQQAPTRVVISDWMMPGLDGLELCRRIRGTGGEYTYFILLSNLSASGENLDQAMSAGVDDFLAKPAKVAELKARLHVAERILNYATQVRQLEEIIPICGYCRKLRDDQNYWSQVEEYIGRQTGASFSHGVCPDCYDRVIVPQMRDLGVEPPPYPQVRRVNP
ncbi:Response regulator MprA [Lacunisphaera limnophila]|uniref:Response regulator MprA n=1 Tax=Lacunisphaera limnophila TaxID=1838286 RepID=A0A1D8ASI2_9BACT|nr:response regulator [Lacunisphaera limnophila]AOS43867.1 Response regulator MprA [Lacunisphaera limnophila]